MPQHKCKVFVNARFDVIWQKLLDKIIHPEKYVQGIRNVQIIENEVTHILRIIQFDNQNWQELKELILTDKSTGIIVYRLIDHPSFTGETINQCRTTNQVYQCELEYEINWKIKDHIHQSDQEKDQAEKALQLALNEMKKVSEEAESVYS